MVAVEIAAVGSTPTVENFVLAQRSESKFFSRPIGTYLRPIREVLSQTGVTPTHDNVSVECIAEQKYSTGRKSELFCRRLADTEAKREEIVGTVRLGRRGSSPRCKIFAKATREPARESRTIRRVLFPFFFFFFPFR